MKRFSEEVSVHYGFANLTTDPDSLAPDPEEAFAGQNNGLAGGVVAGNLSLRTGLHTGCISFAAELLETEPALDQMWEEIVEVSFRPAGTELWLSTFDHSYRVFELPGTEDLRVRFNVQGMDAAREATVCPGPGETIDSYLLQIWAQPAGADRILKQTSSDAAYWHLTVHQWPSQAELSARAEAKRRSLEDEQQRIRDSVLMRDWFGIMPGERLQTVGGNIYGLIGMDRPLADELEQAGPATQRAIARWAARRAYSVSGLADLDWVAPALDAMDLGDPLPPPFDDMSQVWERVYRLPDFSRRLVSSTDGRLHNVSQQAMAVGAIEAAVHPDPLRAAIDAICAAAATFGGDYKNFLAEVRSQLRA